jgi:hypothetical protein
MYELVATLLVGTPYLYGITGRFCDCLVTIGVKRIDSQAIGSGVGFHVLIFPSAVALWPILLRRWISRTGEPRKKGIRTVDSAPTQNSPSRSFALQLGQALNWGQEK